MVRPLADPQVREVAIVRLRVGLGDLLCTVPALRALRRARPDVRVTMVTWAEMGPVVHRMGGYVDDLLPFPGYPGIPERPVDRPLLAAFLRRAPRFDVAIQAYGDSAPAREVTGRLGRFTAGFGDLGGWWLPYPRTVHEIWRHLLLMRHLGVPLPSDPARPEFPERFAAVADGLISRGLPVLIGGVAAESAPAAKVRAAMHGPATDLTGRTTLGMYAALLRRAALLVSSDTGVAHLAAATGTPSVTVFLSGDPLRWRYPGGRHLVARSGKTPEHQDQAGSGVISRRPDHNPE
jgi:ADP-heptose:LPS heptosyltransferase